MIPQRNYQPLPGQADPMVVFAHPDDEIASLLYHRSQDCRTVGVREHLAYVLSRTRVGEDRIKRDFFENCEPGNTENA